MDPVSFSDINFSAARDDGTMMTMRLSLVSRNNGMTEANSVDISPCNVYCFESLSILDHKIDTN